MPQKVDAPPGHADGAARVHVRVPGDADIWFDGAKTTQKGSDREYESPQLVPGQEYRYELRAQWLEHGRTVTQARQVTVHAGDRVNVDFLAANREEKRAVTPKVP